MSGTVAHGADDPRSERTSSPTARRRAGEPATGHPTGLPADPLTGAARAPVPVGPDPSDPSDPAGSGPAKQPLYPRLLRLQHVHPNAWQRAVLGEGMAGLGLLLAMADLASAWSVVVLPVAVAGVVKAHDLLAGLLAQQGSGPRDDAGPEPRA